MAGIVLLDQETIDKIAAGEVVERPSSVVKELVENAIDAGSDRITIEIRDGGTSLIRITDNGCGIEKNQVSLAFCRHATSKIRRLEDLLDIHSLGFRGEALSSIGAVARVELVTKTPQEVAGMRYVMEGSKETAFEETAAPNGTTLLVRDLFYNTPARKKFLKTAQTEGSYITDLVERLALSHPDISFQYINNGQIKLHTSGNGNGKDLVYRIYGREIAANLLSLAHETTLFSVHGFLGKPQIARGNRNLETYFINGRYIRSPLIYKALEEAYSSFMMQHQYPFCILYFTFPGELLDVNVHPSKMELRFSRAQDIYKECHDLVFQALSQKEMIPEITVSTEERKQENFLEKRLEDIRKSIANDSPYERKYQYYPKQEEAGEGIQVLPAHPPKPTHPEPVVYTEPRLSDYSKEFLTEEARKEYRIIGQLFKTYWLVEYEERLYIIDQHAAHEKVLYERLMKKFEKKENTSQLLSPPLIVSLDAKEQETLKALLPQFEEFGYAIEAFGGKEYQISAVPADMYSINTRDLFLELLDDFSNHSGKVSPRLVTERIASMSCKAAVKGNSYLTPEEVDALIGELLGLENPYHCPHGRPTIVSMTRSEIEKDFKRLL